MRPVEEWAARRYHQHGHVAHLVPFGTDISLCGARPVLERDWYGTGSMSEIEKAASLPLCGRCEASASE